MIYKLANNSISQQSSVVVRLNEDDTISSFIFDPANTDYQQFKKDIMAGGELQDADGNVMSADAAKEFIKTLP